MSIPRDNAEAGNLSAPTPSARPVCPLGTIDVAKTDWHYAALRIGEELASVGPDRYYDMTAEQWLAWALAAVRRGEP